jgi:hypothetical protein
MKKFTRLTSASIFFYLHLVDAYNFKGFFATGQGPAWLEPFKISFAKKFRFYSKKSNFRALGAGSNVLKLLTFLTVTKAIEHSTLMYIVNMCKMSPFI